MNRSAVSHCARLLPANISAKPFAPMFRAAIAFLAAALLLIFSPAPAFAQAPTPPTDVVGSWTGALGTGAAKLNLILTINKLSSGEYSGEVNSIDQGAVLPIDSLTLKDNAIHFEVKSVGGIYDGTFNDARTELKGTWTQANVPAQPLSFERSKADAANKDAAKPAKTPGPKTKPIVVPLDVTVPIAPTAFKADGKMHLVYELHILNMAPWDCALTRLEVVSGDSAARSFGTFSGAALEGMLARPGQQSVPEKAILAAGTAAVVYVWVTVDHPEDVPATLRHRLTTKLGDYPEEVTVETIPLAVGTGPVVITPPLKGDHWTAANGPSNTSAHRRALIPIDARAVISQRFAIDWVKLGDDGKTYQGDKLDNKNYYAFGVDALAVADGIVTEVKDGIPLNVPGENSRAVPINLETIGGNHVILDIGNGNFAFYAHLQPGSLRVKLGDKVHRGQVVGLVGNTGNSTEPHLHFHISNASSPLGSEGLPYALQSFEVEGNKAGWKPADATGPPVVHTLEIPLENEIVRFPSDH